MLSTSGLRALAAVLSGSALLLVLVLSTQPLSTSGGPKGLELLQPSEEEIRGARGEDEEWLGLPAKGSGLSPEWRHYRDDGNFKVTRSGPWDWTKYPYDESSFKDGDQIFQNSGEDYGGIALGFEKNDSPPKGIDRYSYFWKVDNPMGYPEETLPARRTFDFDLTTNGQSYDKFWGGKDPIAKDNEGRQKFWRKGATVPTTGEGQGKFDAYWGSHDHISRDEMPGYKGYWREYLPMAGGLAGTTDEDIYGDGGLVWLHRNSYKGLEGDSEDEWQSGDMAWPKPLYHYAVDNTEHDLTSTFPLDKTTAEY